MILPIFNVAGGILLLAPVIQNAVKSAPLTDFFALVAPYRAAFGVVLFVLGAIGLVGRLGLGFGLPLSASFPQAIPAILIGLLLAASILGQSTLMRRAGEALSPYSTLLGVIGIATGLGSLLVGCIIPFVCMAPFGI